jgi:hypothetical protein
LGFFLRICGVLRDSRGFPLGNPRARVQSTGVSTSRRLPLLERPAERQVRMWGWLAISAGLSALVGRLEFGDRGMEGEVAVGGDSR